MNNKDKCRHGFYTDPNGYHIIPEKSTSELIDEAKRLFKTPETVPTPKPLTKQQKEFQASIQRWKKYLEENRGKIPNEWPTENIFSRFNNMVRKDEE